MISIKNLNVRQIQQFFVDRVHLIQTYTCSIQFWEGSFDWRADRSYNIPYGLTSHSFQSGYICMSIELYLYDTERS